MNDNQEEFISWLAGKLEAADESDLKKKLQELGEDGIKQAYQQFLSDEVQQKKDGGRLEYIKCLQAFKKGGKMGCGCNGMKLSLTKENGGSLMETAGPKFKPSKATRKLTPKKVVMGQGMGTITGATNKKYQEGGQLPKQQAAPKAGGNGMQPLTPEQVQEQKVDKKVLEIQGKRNTPHDALSPMEILTEHLKPKQIKAKPEKQIRLLISNDQVFGVDQPKGGLLQPNAPKLVNKLQSQAAQLGAKPMLQQLTKSTV